MTLHPAQSPGSEPAIDIPTGHRRFTGHWVVDRLMLANLPFEAEHVKALAREGVELVLNMCEDSEYRVEQRQAVEVAYRETGIDEDRACQVKDLGAHPLDLLDSAVALIEKANAAGRNVAVHCRGGIERSATVAAAVLIHRDGISATRRSVNCARSRRGPIRFRISGKRSRNGRWSVAPRLRRPGGPELPPAQPDRGVDALPREKVRCSRGEPGGCGWFRANARSQRGLPTRPDLHSLAKRRWSDR